MERLTAPDGTRLAVRFLGDGEPLVCLPGGPMIDCGYLGDLGGLHRHRRLVLLDPRGTGRSAVPADPTTYRCDRQVADVEALREHLGLERLDLLAHSAGANLAYRYAEAHPDRVARLVLVTPSPRGVGVEIPDALRQAVAATRAGEPWYPEAAAAYQRVLAGTAAADDWAAMTPFSYGRWDDGIRDFDDLVEESRHPEAAEVFMQGYEPEVTRPALARLDVPVVVVVGAVDLGNPEPAMREVAALFPHAEVVVQAGAGHFPWVDDPDVFRALVLPYLA